MTLPDLCNEEYIDGYDNLVECMKNAYEQRYKLLENKEFLQSYGVVKEEQEGGKGLHIASSASLLLVMLASVFVQSAVG